MSDAWPTRSTRGRRPWLARAIERDVVVAAAVGLAIGLLIGALAFWVASSRGLDSIDLAGLIELGSTLVAFGLVVGAATTALWRDDLRAAALLLAVVLGGWLGTRAAFYLIPGDSTDGTMHVFVGSSVRQEGQPSTRATCHWDRTAGMVREVRSRQPASLPAVNALPAAIDSAAVPVGPLISLRMEVRVDLADGSSSGGATFDVIAPFSTTRAVRLKGTGNAQLQTPSGRTGEMRLGTLSREDLEVSGVDAAALDLLNHALARLPTTTALVVWECPALP